MLPIIEVPKTIATGMENYRGVFCRDEGFEYVCRYVTGLIISPNKTLQGIYDLQVWEGDSPSRRSMHGSVFEYGWDSLELIKEHRKIISPSHRGQGREIISLDWTFSHHNRGPEIYGNKKEYDYIERRTSRFQTLVTAVISNDKIIDGLDVVVQAPNVTESEEEYLRMTAKESYDQMAKVQERLLELLYYQKHKLEYKKRTEIAYELVVQIEEEGLFPEANYAFDNGVLTLDLTRYIEGCGKHWVSEIECSRHIQWYGEWQRVDTVAENIRKDHPESFRFKKVKCRNGKVKECWVFTKVVRLKRYGEKRLVIVHETEDLTDTPRFYLSDALHWEGGRIIETWSYRWSSEIFHEFGKQVTGLESSQLRKEEGVKRHFRLSCVAHSLVQRASVGESKSEKFQFAKGEATIGQRCRAVAREVLHSMLELSKRLFMEGKSTDAVLDMLMPA
ncbi:hypothetical protein FJZ33_01285 [Candidatus Poribacteria bacterium]|nr:hypothetical protein [Candidatus Poribacteria bacterium]